MLAVVEQRLDDMSKRLEEINTRQKRQYLVTAMSQVSPYVLQHYVEVACGLLVKSFVPIAGSPSLFTNVLPSDLDEHQLIAASTSTLNNLAAITGYDRSSILKSTSGFNQCIQRIQVTSNLKA